MPSLPRSALEAESLADRPRGLFALALCPIMLGAFGLCILALGIMEMLRLFQALAPSQREPGPLARS